MNISLILFYVFFFLISASQCFLIILYLKIEYHLKTLNLGISKKILYLYFYDLIVVFLVTKFVHASLVEIVLYLLEHERQYYLDTLLEANHSAFSRIINSPTILP
jgi:hypothetical protein